MFHSLKREGFVETKLEQQAMLNEMNRDKIRQALLKDSCDWINFKMNVPQASHMGGPGKE